MLALLCAPPVDASMENISELQRHVISRSSQQKEKNTDQQISSAHAPHTDLEQQNSSPSGENSHRQTTDSPRQTTKKELLNGVAENWKIPEPNAMAAEKISPKDLYENTLFDRVNSIFIPQIRFTDTPLPYVIEALTNAAEKNDTAADESSRGVNFVLLGSNGSPKELTVTLNLKNISLYQLIDLVAKSVSYKFDITKDAVIFYKYNMADDIMETQFFSISRGTLIRLTGAQGINHHAHGNRGTAETIADEERGIKEFFQRAGINFSDIPGSNLAFDGSQIIVTNTCRNLKKISNILKKYSEIKQVEIETKFLEVQQGVLDELGVRWQLGDNHKTFFQTGQTSGTSNLDNLRSLTQAFSSTNFSKGDGKIVTIGPPVEQISIPNAAPGLPGQINLGAATVPLGNITGVLNKFQCNMLIQALEQHAGSDLMSAPRLTVLSGKTAEIVVAMELRYPQKYGDMHSEVGIGTSGVGLNGTSAGVTITAGTPQDFTARNIGVEMSVTPIVENDGSISLQLEPKVTEFEGFVEYGGMSIATNSQATISVPSGFYQPIFSTREIHTEVNIFDGATVVMGGLTREEVKEVHDKVPILGNLPLLGRLFQSKSETTQKRNLLIFVTAHTISPFGEKKMLSEMEQKED
jgi:general secretion pathway protein D